MVMKPGDQVSYRMLPETRLHPANVLSIDEGNISLQLYDDVPAGLDRCRYITISESDADVEYFSEVGKRDGSVLKLKRVWTGKRGYFRVDDVFPVVYRPVDANMPLMESRIFSGYGEDVATLEVPDESINPNVWKLLVDMNAKLTLVLNQLRLEQSGLASARGIPVNISASGIRITLDAKVDVGGIYELKMLVPVYPPVGILVHGKLVRIEELESGKFALSLRFIDITDDVQDVIIQYTLKRQREQFRRQREQDQTA